MSLVTFPSNNGKAITVDPRHVTAVRPYRGTLSTDARSTPYDMSLVWVSGNDGVPRVHVCAWPVTEIKAAITDKLAETPWVSCKDTTADISSYDGRILWCDRPTGHPGHHLWSDSIGFRTVEWKQGGRHDE